MQVGRTHNVSSLGLVLSANPNGCPRHQDKGKGEGRLPVQVGRTHNVSSLGLALSTMHHGRSREDTQLSCFKICSVCARTLPHSDFSRKQHHSLLRKCKSCITQLDNSGTKSQVLLRNHRMSNGLVDGILHDVPGKKTQDRAIRCIKDDRTVSQDILTQFLTTFPVKVMRLNNIAALGYNPASFKLCKLMTFIKPTTPIPRDFLNDFLTTIQDPLVSHQEMRQLPSTKPSHSFPVNQFHDSPTMTCGSELRFCCRVSERQHITSFPKGRLLRHVNGTVLLDSNGILIGAQCSKSLHSTFTGELLLVYNQMELHQPYLLRGKEVANICANFVMTGLKEDLNTKLKMTHTSKCERFAHLEMEMRAKLRGIFINHIDPIVVQEFGWLFEPVVTWLDKQDVTLFARFVSGVTAGRLFWPRSHTDQDVWFTVLVCIDYGDGIKGGGDFGFGSIGHVLQCAHGGILVYNPTHHHGTTEFSLIPNNENSGRLFFAFYMKKQTLHADLLTQ